MAQKIQRLTALTVARISAAGLYADGAGLYLRVGRGGAKSWAFRFMLNGRPREMGFGSLTKVSLADARKKASDARVLLGEGHDPIEHRQQEDRQRVAAEKLAAARSMTFEQCAEAYVAAHEVSWKNDKHRQQWRNTLTTDRAPLEQKDGNCASDTWQDRSHPRLGQGPWLSNRREPGTLAWQHRSTFAGSLKGPSSQASYRPPLLRDQRIHERPQDD
jgi:hypothetical protein